MGYVQGSRDELGYKSLENTVALHELQATLLPALGLDDRRPTYPHEGRLERLTDGEATWAEAVLRLLSRAVECAVEERFRASRSVN